METYPDRVYGRNGAIFVQRYSCPNMACGRVMEAFPPKGSDLTSCPVPITGTVDARPVLDVEAAWTHAKPAPYDETVWPKRRWQEQFMAPMRESLMCLGTGHGYAHRKATE
ncbi:hypothetical protein FQZ97_1178880 [compost metagenome]